MISVEATWIEVRYADLENYYEWVARERVRPQPPAHEGSFLATLRESDQLEIQTGSTNSGDPVCWWPARYVKATNGGKHFVSCNGARARASSPPLPLPLAHAAHSRHGRRSRGRRRPLPRGCVRRRAGRRARAAGTPLAHRRRTSPSARARARAMARHARWRRRRPRPSR